MPHNLLELLNSRLAFLITIFTSVAFVSGAMAWAFATFQTVSHAEQDGTVMMETLKEIKNEQREQRRQIEGIYQLLLNQRNQ